MMGAGVPVVVQFDVKSDGIAWIAAMVSCDAVSSAVS